MKMPCEIIRDLIPLYEDEVCSPASREAVEEHLSECEACRSLVKSVRELPEPPTVMFEEDRTAVRSLRKIRRRWRISVLAVLLVIPLMLSSFLGYNQYKERGISYTNIDDILVCVRYLDALCDKDFEKAAALVDFGIYYDEIIADLGITAGGYMPQFAEVTSDGEVWLASDAVAETYFPDGRMTDEGWFKLILNGGSFALIPCDVWDRVTEEYESSFLPDDGGTTAIVGGEYELNGLIYRRIETEWGDFMVNDDVGQILADGDYVHAVTELLELVPLEMHDSLENDLWREAERRVDEIKRRYGAYGEMTKDEFVSHMRTVYADEIESFFSEGYEITDHSFSNAYKLGDEWIVSMFAEFHSDFYGTVGIYYEFAVRDGKLTLYSLSYPGDGIGDFAFLIDPRNYI